MFSTLTKGTMALADGSGDSIDVPCSKLDIVRGYRSARLSESARMCYFQQQFDQFDQLVCAI
ncbi:hypothetical protein [Bosea thiooxidans]